MIHVSRVQTTPVSRVQTIRISRVQTNPRPFFLTKKYPPTVRYCSIDSRPRIGPEDPPATDGLWLHQHPLLAKITWAAAPEVFLPPGSSTGMVDKSRKKRKDQEWSLSTVFSSRYTVNIRFYTIYTRCYMRCYHDIYHVPPYSSVSCFFHPKQTRKGPRWEAPAASGQRANGRWPWSNMRWCDPSADGCRNAGPEQDCDFGQFRKRWFETWMDVNKAKYNVNQFIEFNSSISIYKLKLELVVQLTVGLLLLSGSHDFLRHFNGSPEVFLFYSHRCHVLDPRPRRWPKIMAGYS